MSGEIPKSYLITNLISLILSLVLSIGIAAKEIATKPMFIMVFCDISFIKRTYLNNSNLKILNTN